jgi:hypothetical protein
MTNTATQNQIDQRLDAIDRALMGALPRSERLAMVAQVEVRLLELAAANPSDAANGQVLSNLLPSAESAPLVSSSGGMTRSMGRKRSGLALGAGVLGTAGLVLLFGTPLVYVFVAIIADALGEVFAISLLGAHTVAIALGGSAAVALGIAAIVSLGRQKGKLVGYGWAITGLCAGSLPMLVGVLMILIAGSQMQLARVEARPTVLPESNSAPAPLQELPAANEAAGINCEAAEVKTVGLIQVPTNTHADEFRSEPRASNEEATETGSRSVSRPRANSELAPLSESATADLPSRFATVPTDPQVAPQTKTSEPPTPPTP